MSLVSISPTSATARVLLSKKAKLGSAQTPPAWQPPNTLRIPVPSTQKVLVGVKAIDQLLPIIHWVSWSPPRCTGVTAIQTRVNCSPPVSGTNPKAQFILRGIGAGSWFVAGSGALPVTQSKGRGLG